MSVCLYFHFVKILRLGSVQAALSVVTLLRASCTETRSGGHVLRSFRACCCQVDLQGRYVRHNWRVQDDAFLVTVQVPPPTRQSLLGIFMGGWCIGKCSPSGCVIFEGGKCWSRHGFIFQFRIGPLCCGCSGVVACHRTALVCVGLSSNLPRCGVECPLYSQQG